MVTAGFPCQPVSYAGQQQGTEDERWLFDDIAKGLGILRPRYILLENVPRLLNSPASARGLNFAIILKRLLGMGYDVEWRVIDASHYGMPQQSLPRGMR